jgi:hypothetical protein
VPDAVLYGVFLLWFEGDSELVDTLIGVYDNHVDRKREHPDAVRGTRSLPDKWGEYTYDPRPHGGYGSKGFTVWAPLTEWTGQE